MRPHIKRISVSGSLTAFALTVLVGCSTLSAGTQTQSMASSAGSPTQTASTAPSDSPENPGNFYDLNSDVFGTLYDAGTAITENAIKVTGSFDLNADGKPEDISLTFYRSIETGQKSILQINGSPLQFDLVELEGVYVVDLDKTDNLREIAVVDHGEDDYMTTHFFRFNGSGITDLGEIHGKIHPDAAGSPYNGALQTSGSGVLIPALGIMRFINPQVIINEYQLSGNTLSDIKPDYSGALNKQYTVFMDTSAYFEAMNAVPSDFMPSYDTANSINLKKGQTLLIRQIHDFNWAEVTLDDGRQGALYYFLMS